jgi:hypothetical protein
VLDAAGAPTATIVLGGAGSVWPVVTDTLGDLGAVWQSRTPELDLATGAAWWSMARHRIAGAAAPWAYPVVEEHEEPPSDTPHADIPPPAERRTVHPWLS